MNLNLFNERNINNSINKDKMNFIGAFIEELKNILKRKDNSNLNTSKNNLNEQKRALEEYNLYEKRKIFLDNKTKNGNNLAWIMDNKSVCVSEQGDGGPFFIKDVELPANVKVGEVYEEINGKYMYNPEITTQLNNITLANNI